MFETISISGVIIIAILLYVFRPIVKQINEEAPIVVSNTFSAVTKASHQLNTIVSTNCAENEVECQKRINHAFQEMKDNKLMPVSEAYDKIMGMSK